MPDLVLKLDASDYATCAAKKEDARVMGAIRFHERNRLRTALMLTNIPISPARAAAGSATLDENAAPEPRPTQETHASAASLVQPAAAAAAGPVQPASSIAVGSQVIRGPDWKWGKQVCRRVARHASADACCMRACAHLRLRSRACLPRAALRHRAVTLRLDASSGWARP